MTPSKTLRSWLRRPARIVATIALGGSLAGSLLVASAAASFNPDSSPTGWVSRLAMSSNDLSSGTEVVFRPGYKAGVWTGTVHANYISAAGQIQNTGPWPSMDTATALNALTSAPTTRRIVTRHPNGTGIPFSWTTLDNAQKSLLGNNTTGPALVNYIRGDRSNEAPNGSKLRKRESIQGDIQHSSLVYWNHGAAVRRLYVGGNDGMLHAFDAATGSEVFAYVPSMLMSRLPRLAAEPYVHTLFVDGGLAIADVNLGATTKTLLAGALGGGGRGLFMLDVSNPTPASESAAAAMVKWEITPATPNFANLGFSYAAPKFARLENGVAVVVVGNGYMNAGTGRASLFVINADTGARVCEIDTGSGSLASPNGLSTAILHDSNSDGRVDFAFAGDIDGNLWRFDLRGTSAPACTATKLLTTSPQQAITSAPVVVPHPNGGRLVLFGTGRILTTADDSDTSVHYVYGVWDGAPVTNTSWLDQVVTEVTVGTQRLRTVTSNVPNWAPGGHRGWRLALPAGERVLGEAPFVNDGRLYFVGTNPTVEALTDSDASGANWLMEVSALSGGAPASPIFDVNGDGRIDSADNVGGAVAVGQYLGAGVISQAVLTDRSGASQTLLNRQSDLDYSPPSSSGGRGVSGGHFDPDFYFNPGSGLKHVVHVHEYDDKYDVTGVNFLNASDDDFNLGSKLSPLVGFKVLVMNQYLNPAAQISVGGSVLTSVKAYGGQTTATSASSMLASQLTYKLSNIQTLAFNLPLDGFKSKDWWGDGGPVRAGLLPTKTGCVKNLDGNGNTPILGPNGERHNGALTLQLVRADTPASVVELNYTGGGAAFGWRVKAGQVNTYVVAEYTLFWHHPNNACYGSPGWVPNPPEDFDGGGRASTAAANSTDPREGTFGVTPAGVTVTSVTTTTSANVTTTVVTYSDGKTRTTVVTLNGDGTETVTTTQRDGSTTTGTRMSSGATVQPRPEVLLGSRRVNWREVIRQ